jgi:undecaprenyl-diphosphatase
MILLIVNGFILLAADHFQKQNIHQRQRHSLHTTAEQVSHKLNFTRAAIIGVAQIFALFAGISRSGITMVAGLYNGLSNEDAARFSFLLATPIIMAAGVLKLPDFFKPLDQGVRSQILVGGLAAAIGAYLAVRYLDKYFQKRGLRPFALYCILAGVFCIGLGLFRGHF